MVEFFFSSNCIIQKERGKKNYKNRDPELENFNGYLYIKKREPTHDLKEYKTTQREREKKKVDMHKQLNS